VAVKATYRLRYARANATADGDNVLIAAPGAREQITVLGYALNVNAAGVIILQDSANVPVASFEFVDSGGMAYAGGFDCPAFELPVGTGLEVNNAAGVDTTGHITYVITTVN
jgi:hypothetical protein